MVVDDVVQPLACQLFETPADQSLTFGIQVVELAVRIAGGRDAVAEDWRDVAVPPGSLFVVGDPKQSIYRFRRASISTYLEAGALLGRRLSLVTNFRTVPPVVDWVNEVFGAVQQAVGL